MALQERLNKRRNFLPTVLLSIVLWIVWATLFLLVPPEYFLMPIAFLLVTFLACLFTFALVFGNTRRGLIVAGSVILFMIFSFYGLGNYLNFILIVGIAIALEYYLSRR